MSSSMSLTQIKKMEMKEIEIKEIEIKREGIKFAIAGNAGYGKTSTLNALFGSAMKTDGISPATQEIQELSVLLKNIPDSQFSTSNVHDVNFYVFDLPGLNDGETDYFEIYAKLLPSVDVILWTLRADVKAFGSDIQTISRLIKLAPSLKSKIIIGLNFIDSVTPQNWDFELNIPSSQQDINIKKITERILSVVHEKCGLEKKVTVAYSANQAYGLETLFNRLIGAVSEEKRWVFANLKLNYREAFLQKVPAEFREKVAKIYVPA